MEFDLEYKIKLFREEQPSLYDEFNKRYSATPIGKETAETMLEIINELEIALLKSEQESKEKSSSSQEKENPEDKCCFCGHLFTKNEGFYVDDIFCCHECWH